MLLVAKRASLCNRVGRVGKARRRRGGSPRQNSYAHSPRAERSAWSHRAWSTRARRFGGAAVLDSLIEPDAASPLGFLDEVSIGFVTAFAGHHRAGCERETKGILLVVEVEDYLPGRHAHFSLNSRSWRGRVLSVIVRKAGEEGKCRSWYPGAMRHTGALDLVKIGRGTVPREAILRNMASGGDCAYPVVCKG